MSEDKKETKSALYKNTGYEDGDVELDSRGYMKVNSSAVVENKDTTQTDEGPEPNTPEEDTWKKRYADLRRHTDKKFAEKDSETKRQIAELAEELRLLKDAKNLTSDEDIEKFRHANPDLANIIETLSAKKLKEYQETAQAKVEALEDELNQTKIERAMARISAAFPDWEDIRASKEFHGWLDEQPAQIKEWAYESQDAELAIRVIKLFKADNGDIKPAKKTSAKPNGSAADFVDTRKRVDVTESKEKKIWSEKEIQRMSLREFEKHEDEIRLAAAQGRIKP